MFFLFFTVENISPERFELLCTDGRRAPISEYRQCNWGLIPSDAIVTSSARNALERKKYQKFLMKVVELYSDILKDETQAQGQNGNVYNYGNNNFGNNNNYYNERNNAYDNNPYNNYNRDRFENTGYRNERLDSSFTTDRNYNENGLNESIPYEKFRIFESKRYGKVNLLFQVRKTRTYKIVHIVNIFNFFY